MMNSATPARTFKTYSENGWRVGNVFDTMTDYLFRFPDAERSPGYVANWALSRWRCSDIQNSMCWYDDYGWWGIASAKAFLDPYASIFGPVRSEFQDIATECWNVMQNGKPHGKYTYRGAPNVWANRDERPDPGYWTKPETWAQPRFLDEARGVWQYEMFKEERAKCPKCDPCDRQITECSYINPSDPITASPSLGPFQLTVMNGLYFVLALRLRGLVTGIEKAFEDEREWLQHWFFDKTIWMPEHKLLWQIDNTSVLVRERVSTYDHCAAINDWPKVQGYLPKAAWCGDQGLILGGFLDYLQVHSSDPVAQSLPGEIMHGVFSGMVNAWKVVLPMTEVMNGIDDHDYNCGSGVFWRYLLGGFCQKGALHDDVLSYAKADPENNAIYKSAEDACQGNSPGDQLFKPFNALATLLAAIEILPEVSE
jgi:hypothetical protein